MTYQLNWQHNHVVFHCTNNGHIFSSMEYAIIESIVHHESIHSISNGELKLATIQYLRAFHPTNISSMHPILLKWKTILLWYYLFANFVIPTINIHWNLESVITLKTVWFEEIHFWSHGPLFWSIDCPIQSLVNLNI